MKKNTGKIITVIMALMVLFFGIHSTGQAAVVNNLIKVPTANIISNQGAVAGELYGDRGRFEAVYRIDPQLEVGGEIYTARYGSSRAGFLARVLFARETSNSPAVAAGIRGRDLYATASKSLGYGVSGHIGFGNDRFGGLYVGLNKVINPVSIEITEEGENKTGTSTLPTTNLMVEYINQEINFGARVNLKNTLYLDLGILDLDQFKVGLNYGF